MSDPSFGDDDDGLDIDDRRPVTRVTAQTTLMSPLVNSASMASPAPTIGGGLADSKQVEQSLKDVQLTPDSSGAIPQATIIDPNVLKPMTLAPGMESLSPFASMYEEMQGTLNTSMKNEARWLNKCRLYARQILAHAERLTKVMALHEQDLKTKVKMQEDIASNRIRKNDLQEDIKDLKAKVRDVRAELKKLGEVMDDRSSDSIKQQRATIAKLELEISKFTMTRDKEKSELDAMRKRAAGLAEEMQKLDDSGKKSERELDTLKDKIHDARKQANAEADKKANLNSAMQSLQKQVYGKQEEVDVKKELINKERAAVAEVEKKVAKAERDVHQKGEKYRVLKDKTDQRSEKLRIEQEANEGKHRELKKLQKIVEEKRQKKKEAKASETKERVELESKQSDLRALERRTAEIEGEKRQMEDTLATLKVDILELQGKLSQNKRDMDTQIRQREVLSQNQRLKGDDIRMKESVLQIKKSTLKNIKNEYQGYLQSIRHLSKIIEGLKRDKLAHEAEVNKREAQQARAMEEVKDREAKIAQFQEQAELNDFKLREQQNLLERLRTDRNAYRKLLIEQKNEMKEYRRTFIHLNHRIKQLKTEIHEKDVAFVTEHFNLEHVNSDMAHLTNQNKQAEEKLGEQDEIIKKRSREIRKLTTIVADADEELRVQRKQYNTIVNEQRVLNQQLIERNEELANLYEKLKLQNSMLEKGAVFYKEKKEVVAKMKATKEELDGQLGQVKDDIKRFGDLKTRIDEMEREIVEEKLRVKALSDELRKPINVHRWRRLQDTNADAYAMIKRVRELQKQLIIKAGQVEYKDKTIQEREKLYVELRRVLARQPGSEAEEQLRLYESTLKDKRSKLKQMRAELKVYQAKVNELKYEIQKMVQDLKVVKLEYFAKRRRMLQASRASSRPDNDIASQIGDDGMPLYDEPSSYSPLSSHSNAAAADSKQPLFAPSTSAAASSSYAAVDKLPSISPRVASSSTSSSLNNGSLTLSSVGGSPDNTRGRRPSALVTSSLTSSKSFDSPPSASSSSAVAVSMTNDGTERLSARGNRPATDTILPSAPGSSHGNRPRSSHSSSGSVILPAAAGAQRRPTAALSSSSTAPAAWADDDSHTMNASLRHVGSSDMKEEKQRRRPTRPAGSAPLEI